MSIKNKQASGIEKTLIVISVPYTRNIRYLLCSDIYDELKENYDILIVSPFANNKQFQEEFKGERVKFFQFESDTASKNSFVNKIYNISEQLRVQGYYYKYRNSKMKSYWRQYISLNKKSKFQFFDKLFNLKYWFRINIGIFGRFSYSWKLLDSIFGFIFYNGNEYLKILNAYKKIILIQCASWGYQERFLAYYARKFHAKMIFLPYTTDQLSIGGFLLAKYDTVCVQGNIELDYATSIHKISIEKIMKMGCLWLRNLDKYSFINNDIKPKGEKNILYAGVASAYFSRETEYNTLDKLAESIASGRLINAKIIYRPVCKNDFELNEIVNRYNKNPFVSVAIPQIACIGLEEYPKKSIENDIRSYIYDINKADVFIMSLQTSMLIEMAYINTPSISNYIDTYLDITGEDFLKDLKFDVCSRVTTIEDLISKTIEAFELKEWQSNIREEFLEGWDFNNENYVENFMKMTSSLLVT